MNSGGIHQSYITPPLPPVNAWGQIRGTLLNAGAGTYDFVGTVTADGISVVDDGAGRLQVKRPNSQWKIEAECYTDAEMASGFNRWFLRCLVNAVIASDNATFTAWADQPFSGPGGVELGQSNKSGVAHVMVPLAFDDIVNAEAFDPGDFNPTTVGNLIFTVTLTYEGEQ